MSSLPRRLPYVRLGKEDDSIISSKLAFPEEEEEEASLSPVSLLSNISNFNYFFPVRFG